MRLMTFFTVVIFCSCGQGTDKTKSSQQDLMKTIADTDKVVTNAVIDIVSLNISAIEKRVKESSGSSWQVVNDSIADWPKDVFDYFIGPKRKDSPYYPYIVLGDFNGDGKPDQAYLMTNEAKSKYQIAISLSTGNIVFWKEDIDLAAISTMPKTELGGIDGQKIKMKGDGINVEYYEKSSFVLYWNGTNFKRIWTSD